MKSITQVFRSFGQPCPSFHMIKKAFTRQSPTYQLLDVCINDCVVFIDAPAACDPHRLRQNSGRTECPVCREPRFVTGGERGKESEKRPRKQFFHFSISSIFRFLFSQPGWSEKLNRCFGVKHPSERDPDWLMEVRLLRM